MDAVKAGAAIIDITPPPGLLLAGFAARSEPATGVHDPLTVRALVIGDLAIVVADVIGITAQSSERIRARSGLPPENLVIAATHTHGAPSPMPDRLGMPTDDAFLAALEEGCVAAIAEARRTAVPARFEAGYGPDPDVARNRRHADGPLDRNLPVLRVIAVDTGHPIALMLGYACHPTVLGADNRLMTADYPAFARRAVEAAHPGAVALFLTGCAGDANIGHAASASWTTATSATRTFENAERLGRRIGDAALAAPLAPVSLVPTARTGIVELALDRPEGDLRAAAGAWQAELDAGCPPPRALLLPHWVAWAKANADRAPGQWSGRVSVVDFGPLVVAAMPGEIFAETGLAVRAALGGRIGFVLAYADDTPGYIPPITEYPFGGYEVDEAHRFVGLAGRFAPGSAERLAKAVIDLLNPASH
ncbi:alkaline ceramidase [Arsenicitalea aurantiaca]|uniref:Alkaline ceramidase n=1 Tax=Arsenicitalea aurantiaca TaxID=1783274 RepID=A0A433XK68_9HYPH|nr:neutral/alkaline non-lysosomal ceramidase N-terminal domain-containing protein [Arsenicitalea aurantiaca]RUT34477.1 alkaline ceramidase [Arsenicitalea aurantiaca]